MEDYKAWIPSEYLAQYYATGTVAEDERGILRFITDFLKNKNIKISEMLEVGCGPTIHHAIPFVPYVDRLYMADYLESNLLEIKKVIDLSEDAHDWTPYLSGILNLEGNNHPPAGSERLQAFRAKIAGFLPCNVLYEHPLGRMTKLFSLVTSFYCLECVSNSKEQWHKAMANVARLVAPSGWMILSALRSADKYLVCGKEFPATSIDEGDMRQSLIDAGFVPKTIIVEVCPCEWAEEGFDSIIVCSAQKETNS